MAGRRVPIIVFVAHTMNDKLTDGTHLYFDAKALLEEDLRVESVIVPEDSTGGDLIDKVLDNLQRSDYFLVLLTRAAIGQPWVCFEFGVARKAVASSNRPVLRNDKERLRRFVLLVPKLNQQWPGFCDQLIQIQWEKNAGVDPTTETLDGRKLKCTWNSGVRNEHVRAELGRRLLTGVFGGNLEHIVATHGRFPRSLYDLWLDAFAAWSRGDLFAVSRQPLTYWWKGDGLSYRETLKTLLPNRGRITRLTVWEKPEDAFPIADCAQFDDSMIARGAGRQEGFRYCCEEAKVYDMLYGFQVDCHDSVDDACYALLPTVCDRIPAGWEELLQYENQFVIKARGVLEETVTYELRYAREDEAGERFFSLHRAAKNEKKPIVSDVTLPNGLRIPGAGRISGFLEAIRQHHDSRCSQGHIILPAT